MNITEIKEIAFKLSNSFPEDINGADKADIFAYLAVETGLTHLMIPDAIPLSDEFLQIPSQAPEYYQKRKDRRERPHEFIRRVYSKWLGKGLARHHLLHLDKSLYHALCCWLTKNDIPDWLDLPTKKQINDRELEGIGVDEGDMLPYPSYYKGLKDKLRLYNAARNRK